MIAEVKQILFKPAKYSKDGELLHPRYAAININVPLEGKDEQVIRDELLDALNAIFVNVSFVADAPPTKNPVDPRQQKLPIGNDDKVKMAKEEVSTVLKNLDEDN